MTKKIISILSTWLVWIEGFEYSSEIKVPVQWWDIKIIKDEDWKIQIEVIRPDGMISIPYIYKDKEQLEKIDEIFDIAKDIEEFIGYNTETDTESQDKIKEYLTEAKKEIANIEEEDFGEPGIPLAKALVELFKEGKIDLDEEEVRYNIMIGWEKGEFDWLLNKNIEYIIVKIKGAYEKLLKNKDDNFIALSISWFMAELLEDLCIWELLGYKKIIEYIEKI